MKIVKVNKDTCIGCGACIDIAEDNFTFGDDGLAEAITPEINDDNKEDVLSAQASCPMDAIIIEEKSID